MVIASTEMTLGEAVYVGWSGWASISRHRSQPARCRARMDAAWVSGTCSTTSPGLLSPPVSSEETSQASQPESVHASQTTGGRRGSMLRPDTGQSIRSSTAQLGTAPDSPISRASSGDGG